MLAFFVISTQLGGAEKSLLDLLIELKNRGENFVVIAPKKDGPLLDRLKEHSIKIIILPIPPWALEVSRKKPFHLALTLPFLLWFYFKFSKKVALLIKEQQIRLIHSTGLKLHLLLGTYAYFHQKIRLVIHLRDIVSNHWLKRMFIKLSTAKNITWIANSKITGESILPIKSQLVYNGFADIAPSIEPIALKSELGLSEDCFLVGVVGAIARWKGQREFIEMAKELSYQNQKIHFLIIGDEIYDTLAEKGEMNLLKNKVSEYGLSNRIHFLGFQKNIARVYQSLDVLVHSSIQPEPFGRVIVEAMIHGCAVTASAQGGPLEIIKDKENGLLHSPGNIASMTENVLYLYRNKEKANDIRTNGLKASQVFSLKSHVDQMASALGLS